MLNLAFQVHQRQRDVAEEFPEDLAAGPAWWSELRSIGCHGNRLELPRALRNGFEYGDSLSTYCKAVGRVFDVASAKDTSVISFNCGSNQELRVRRMRVQTRGKRGLYECLIHEP